MSPRTAPYLFIALVTVTSPTRAQSFNLDVGDADALPSATYAGAAASPGVWQALTLDAGEPVSLVTVTGEASGVTLVSSATLVAQGATLDVPTGDDALLLEDWVALDTTPTTLTLSGLAAGSYELWIYAWAPGDPTAITYVAVDGDTQAVSGAWPGDFGVFVTHALHTTKVAAGADVVVSVVGVDAGALSGMQIVRLPDPPPPIGDPQGFNLDAGAELGQPSRGWGGAADQPGVWMQLSFNIDNPVTLNGLGGEPTTVTLAANLPFGPAWYDHAGPSGDAEKLLEDYLDLHTTAGRFMFHGVPAGDYLVYTYAWAPDDDRYRTRVTIGEDTQEIGGAWTGALSQGVTHARHAVTVPASGELEIYTFGTKGTLNGIQLVPVVADDVEPSPEVAPEPVVDEDNAAELVSEEAVTEEVMTEEVAIEEASPEVGAEPAAEPGPEAEPDAAEAEVVVRGGGDEGCHGGPAVPSALALFGLALALSRWRRIGTSSRGA